MTQIVPPVPMLAITNFLTAIGYAASEVKAITIDPNAVVVEIFQRNGDGELIIGKQPVTTTITHEIARGPAPAPPQESS